MNLRSFVATAVLGTATVGGMAIAHAQPTSTTTPVASAPAPVASAPECRGTRDGEWPDLATGRPAHLDAGDTGGVYLWHDDSGWHLRVTHRGDARRVYTGTLSTRGTITAQPVSDERGDRVWVGPNDHELHFQFVNYGHIDGVDFQTRCAPRLDVGLRADGQQLATERIFIGHADVHPTSDPFVIERAR